MPYKTYTLLKFSGEKRALRTGCGAAFGVCFADEK